MRYYYVTHAGRAVVTKIATTKTHLSLNDCYRILKCSVVENASTKVGGKTCTLVVDENGKWMGRMLNPAGSYLLNRPGDCVAGPAIVTKNSSWLTFTEEQAKEFDKTILSSVMRIQLIQWVSNDADCHNCKHLFRDNSVGVEECDLCEQMTNKEWAEYEETGKLENCPYFENYEEVM